MIVYYSKFETPLGKIRMAFSCDKVVKISFSNEDDDQFFIFLSKYFDKVVKAEKVPERYEQEIIDYLDGKLKEFHIPIELKGTPFQVKVWKELLKIPYGETRSYKEISIAIGREKAFRGIGQACSRNPIPLIVPCHRVIGSNGELVGYAGGIELKEKLLNMEEKILESLPR